MRAGRLEDAALVRGAGRFVDDIAPPGVLHAAFVRSPVAHALLRRIDATGARAVPGVRAVLTHAELRPLLTADRIPLALPGAATRFHVDPFPLALREATYVGEPLALVVADSRRIAEDAAALVALELEPLRAVLDPRDGLAPDAPKARLDCPDNLVARHRIEYGDIDAAFAGAAHRIAERFRLDKGGGHPIETRGLVAHFDPGEALLTVSSNTQLPHRAKAVLVAALGLGEHQVRVAVPTTGGAFGTKAVFHPEELVVPAAAILLRRPIKWIEDRREHFLAAAMERRQDWEVEAACDAEGRLRGIRGRLCYDHGAATPYGVALPYNAATNLIGPYNLPAYRIAVELCLTNLAPAAPTRGAGRPQGTYVMERLLDRIAQRLGLPREEVRRRNLIPADAMPYRTPVVQRDGSAMTYDSGDYPESQRRALEAAGWDDFPARRDAARRAGRWLGIGLSNYVEATGRGPFESAVVRVGPSGKIVLATGATEQGQGIRTTLAALAAAALGVDPADVTVIAGDTAAVPLGMGAFASRQAVAAGSAVFLAAQAVRDKALAAAGEMLEASAEDLELADGQVRVKGAPQLSRSLGEIARALGGLPGMALPKGMAPGLAAASDYQPASLAYCNGTHVAEVEVDPETGAVRILRYVVVHDCGRMLDPALVEGQVRGGVAHGIGATLYEWMRYDAEGQPLTVTYGDYLLPTADAVPAIEVHHMESPSPLNPLGVKGAAESGTIAAPAALAAAIEDALAPLGVTIRDLPVTPDRLRALIAGVTSP
ncbi:MAG TPA: xanthine dehydrogenase family protein molybdopterin-binding subunit [Stellaceae bacterium]|nr:xanthine dehydrogenase family protein molybdopterin-binding subunit [Stellaceae bacterium]